MSDPVAAAPQPTAQETPAPNPNLHKVKIDGAELEVPYEELVSGYQTRKASDKAFREGAEIRKQAEQLVQLLKSDPISVLADPRLGLDVRKIAEEYLAAQIGDELMDPKERELRDLKKWREAREKEDNEKLTRAQQEENDRLTQEHIGSYSNGIIEALESSQLPKNATCVKRMAYYMHEGLKRGLELSPKDVVGLVREDFENDFRSLYGSADGEVLLGLLGEEGANKIRKHDLSRLKQTGAYTAKQGVAAPKAARVEQKSKGISKDEWRQRMKEIARG